MMSNLGPGTATVSLVLARAALDQIRHVVAGQQNRTALLSGTPRPKFTRRWIISAVPERACEGRLLPTQQPRLPYHLCSDHVDDRRLAALVGLEPALQRILELLRIGHIP